MKWRRKNMDVLRQYKGHYVAYGAAGVVAADPSYTALSAKLRELAVRGLVVEFVPTQEWVRRRR